MFEWLFKHPQALFREGELVLEPVSAWLAAPWVLIAVPAAVFAGSLLLGRDRTLAFRRRSLLALLQAVFVLGVLLLLARPALEVESLTPGANSVAVLMDGSGSMDFPLVPDRDGSRLQGARSAVAEQLVPALTPLAEVAVFGFGTAVTRQPLEAVTAAAPRTRLVGAVEDVLASFRDTPLAGVIVLSDGGDNAGGFDLESLREAGVPVHTVGVGPEEMPGEVELADVAMPAEAPPNSRVAADITLRHNAAGPATLKVRDGGRLIAARDLVLDPASATARVPVSFDSGPGGIRELAFEVVPPAGDALARNNRVARLLTVSERRRRVLYLEGEPRWEYKFIRRALEGDDVLALTSWLRTTDRKTYRQNIDAADELAEGFPATLASLYDYDVIVLGSLAATDFDAEQQRLLERFVAERGGSLLALAGRRALADGGWDTTPLADALPVTLERRPQGTYVAEGGSVRRTRLGATAAMLELGGEGGEPFASLPALGDHQRLGPVKPAAAVLLEVLTAAGAQPLLVSQPYGLGTAAVLATATTWRWQMRTSADDRRHTLFWRQLLRQLAETAQQPRALSLEVVDHQVTIRLLERDEEFAPRAAVQATARVTGPEADGAPVALSPTGTPGVLEGRFRAAAAGVYRLDVTVAGEADAITRFVRLGGGDAEYFRPARNAALLRRLAETTGGRYWELDEVGGIADTLRLAGAGITQRERHPLWDMPAAFLLLLLVKGGEWLLRRRWGRI